MTKEHPLAGFPTGSAAATENGAPGAYHKVRVELENAPQGGSGGVLPLEIYAYALDASGAIQDCFYQSLAFDLDKAGAQLRQGGLRFFGHPDLAPRRRRAAHRS